MNDYGELSEIMQTIAEKSLALFTNLKNQPEEILTIKNEFTNLIFEFHNNFLLTLCKKPEPVFQIQVRYYHEALGLVQKQIYFWLQGESMPIQDKRFTADEWVENPFFNLLSQHYLLASEYCNLMLNQLDYDDNHLEKRIKFFLRQYLDALSPTNFLYTNPQVIKETLQSQGKNLLRGFQNVLSDLEKGPTQFIINMTDYKAFEVGKNIAATPGRIIFRNDLMELIQYTPQTSKVRALPLLIVPPWINKYYVLDLSEHNSFIRWLVRQGISVFAISWVNPDAAHLSKGLYDYLNEGPLAAIKIIQKQLAVKKINLLGFCIGGTLTACLLSYLKTMNEMPIQSATFLATLIDFSDPGDIAVFIDEKQISNIEKKIQPKGFLDGHLMTTAFNALKANDLIWSFFVKNYLKGQSPVPFDILYWNNDATNLPAKMLSEYLRWMYLDNNLIKKHKIQLNNILLDVHQIDIPTFFISTQKDHIAPWKTTYRGFQAMAGKKYFLLGESGHIAGIVNPPANQKYGFYYNRRSFSTADEWLANTRFRSGSWWPTWFAWLEKVSGRLISAPQCLALPYSAICDAPGMYVHKNYQQNEERKSH